MAYETFDNSGTLGRNDRATKDNHPSHKGSARIGGVDYWISAWVKEAKTTGSKFFSLSFEPCDTRDAQLGDDGHARPYSAASCTKDGVGQGGVPQGPSRGSQVAYEEDDLPF